MTKWMANFTANLPINKQEAIYFFIKTIAIVFIFKNMGPSQYYLSLYLILFDKNEIILPFSFL